MSDFATGFWAWYVGILAVVGIVACAVLLLAMSKRTVAAGVQTTGHTWDENLGELNNPLPRWWMWLFYITIFGGLAYLVVFPGLGTFRGSLGWSSVGQYESEMKQADQTYGMIYARYAGEDLTKLAANPEARGIGQKLFLNYCSQCHGSDAAGGKGFPNLADDDWLWGGDPQTIEATISGGRHASMPAWGKVLGDEGVKDVANYVRSLSGLAHDDIRTARGANTFKTICAACHGAEGKGNTAIGAPNLTDKTWEYGSSEATIIETVSKGRDAQMPPHKQALGDAKIHLLAAYVYSLSHAQGQ